MKSKIFNRGMVVGLAASSLLFLAPLGVTAQEATPQQEGSGGQMGMHEMRGEHHKTGMRAEMRQRHERMEKMHEEMTKELQKQMTALQENAKAMEGITDEKPLLEALKKHQQLSDAVLETLVKQRERMHEQMKAMYHHHMHGKMGKSQPSKESGTEQGGEQEQHPGE